MKDNVKNCIRCLKEIKVAHFNQKKCLLCRKYLEKYPNTTLTNDQIKKAKSLIGIKNRHEICEEIGASLSSLKRAFRGTRFPQLTEYNKETVLKVCSYYEQHGKVETEKKFPEIKVRSIIERNYDKFNPRQVKWNGNQLIELAKMAGLISFKGQAKYFNRPRANEGSIKSAWVKNYKLSSNCLNGLTINQSKYIVTKECPSILVKPLKRRDNSQKLNAKRIRIWVDIEHYLKPEIPAFLKDGIKAMAEYQRWIFKSKNPKNLILMMIKEREV